MTSPPTSPASPRRGKAAPGHAYGFSTLFKDSAIYGAGRWLQKFLSMLLLPLYTSYLTPHDYGILGLILATQMLIDVFITFGWDVTFSRFYFDDKDDDHRRVVITHTFYVDTVYPIIVLGALAAIMPWLSKAIVGAGDWQPQYTLWFDIALLTLFFTNINDLPFQLFRLDHKPWRFFSFTMARIVVQIPLTIVLVAVVHLGVLGVLIGNLVAAAVMNVASLPYYITRLKFTWDSSLFKEMLAFGSANFFATVAFFALNFADRYMLRFLASVTAVGLYTAGYMLAQPVYFAGYAFRLAWPQWHYSFLGDPPEHKRRVARGYTYFTFISGVLIVVLGVVLPLMIRVLLRKPAFWSVGHVTMILLIGTAVFNSYHLFLVGVNVTKKNKGVPILVVIAAAVCIGLNFVLIPRYSTVGAAYSMLISFTLLAVMMRQLSQHYYPIPHEWKRVARVVLAVALTLGAAWGVFRLTGYEGQYSQGIASVSSVGAVSLSSDGGATWLPQPEDAGSRQQGVGVAGNAHGWEVTALTLVSTQAAGVPVDTGGHTETLAAASFPQPAHGWVLSPGGGTLRATSDGGQTWMTQPTGASQPLAAVAFPTLKKGWLVGAAGTILTTTDGGASWTAQSAGVTADLHAVSFVDAHHGWAVGDAGTALQTTDGGAAWTPLATGTTAPLVAVAFSDVSTGWIAADGGTSGTTQLLSTGDDGHTWTTRAVTLPAGSAALSSYALIMPFGQLLWRQALALPTLLIFPLVLWLTRFFTPGEVRALRALLARRRRGRRGEAAPPVAPSPGPAPGVADEPVPALATLAESVAVDELGPPEPEPALSEEELAEEEDSIEQTWNSGVPDQGTT